MAKPMKNALPFLSLGKKPARPDAKALKFAPLLKKKVSVPVEYDFDVAHSAVPTPMYRNDDLGDCVIAGRAHQTLRFELLDQGKLIKISDEEVENEYFSLSGGKDIGLVVRDALEDWRTDGWIAGKRRLKIHAYADLDRSSRLEIKRAIFLDVGCGIGLQLPLSAQKQLAAGKAWDVVAGAGSKPNSWGGHYVYVSGYTKRGPVCVTWGRKQQMTWKFFEKYCDEAYGIIDAVTTKKLKTFLDVKRVNAFLAAR
jgi:hypothetical protein